MRSYTRFWLQQHSAEISRLVAQSRKTAKEKAMYRSPKAEYRPDELVTILDENNRPIRDGRITGPSVDEDRYFVAGCRDAGAIHKDRIVPRFHWRDEAPQDIDPHLRTEK